MPLDYAGNTLGTARELNITPKTQTLTDWVGSTDTNDFYRFSLSGRASFNLTLNGLAADADVRLLDRYGNTLVGSYNSGSIADSIRRTLDAGTYYVQVYPYGKTSTYYNLNISATPVTPPDYAGNTTTSARNISVGSTNSIYTDWVGSADTNDYYRFSLSQNSNFQLSLNSLTADADVQLLRLNSDGTTTAVGSSIAASNTGEAININGLAAGTYFARVYQYSGDTYYNLNLSANPITTTTNPANWTFMVYMAGHDLETFGIQDFLEMAAVGSNSNVNIVAEFDRTAGYTTAYSDWTDTRRGIIRSTDTPSLNWGTSIGEVNMGDANTLRDFINWSTTNYQANNYALVLWGHGSGLNAAYDDITNDSISASELSSVLSGLSRSISLVGTDACLMGNLEFAYQIRNNASVFVGSQEVEPGQGWNYTSVLSDLSANSSMSAAGLGSSIVNRYGQYYNSAGSNGVEETLSAINLVSLRSTNPNNLATAISSFATTVMNSATSGDRSQLALHRSNSAGFYDPNYRDLGTLLSRIANDATMTASIRTVAGATLSAYNSMIISNYSSISQRATGLSINFQPNGTSVSSSYNSTNLAFAADTTWDEFLRWWAV